MNFLAKVITNNTGVSSKSFIMVTGMLLASEVTQVMLVLTVWDYIETKELNYTGISLLLTALSSVILAAAWGKIKGEQSEVGNTTDIITPIVD